MCYHDLIGDIYDCIVEPSGWPTVLEQAGRILDADNSSISRHDLVNTRPRVLLKWNIDSCLEEAMQKPLPTNPLTYAGWRSDIDEPYTAIGCFGEAAFVASRWYKEALRPKKLHDAMLYVLGRTAGRFELFAAMRGIDRNPIGTADLAKLRLIAPHIRRAIGIGDLLETQTLQQAMVSDAVDLLTVGVILVDAKMRIVHANRAALRELESGMTFRRAGEYLSARNPRAARELKETVARLSNAGSGAYPDCGIGIPIQGAAGHEMVAWILPLHRGMRRDVASPFNARYAIFLKEEEKSSPFPDHLFARRYQLTRAEIRALTLLIQGMNSAECAEALGVSANTMKTHLQNILRKTGARRQAELMKLTEALLPPALLCNRSAAPQNLTNPSPVPAGMPLSRSCIAL